MKNTLLLSLVLVSCTVTANAQAKKSGEIKFGPCVGIGFIGGKIGAFGEYKFTKELGVGSALLCSAKMHPIDVSNGWCIWPERYYIAIPVILKYYSKTKKRLSIFMGGEVGYLVAGKKGYYRMGSLKNGCPSQNLLTQTKIDFRKIDLSIIGGFDYETSFGLIGGVAFSKGLIDVIKNKAMVFNWTFYYLTLGYNFGIFIQ